MKKLVFVVVFVLGLIVALNAAFAETDPDYAAALKLYNSKQYNRAAEQLKEYVKKNPTAAAYYLLGYALYKVGSFDEANEYFKEAYLLDPDFSLEKAGLIQKHPEEKIVKTEEGPISEPQKPSVPETKTVEPGPTAPVTKLPAEIKPVKPKAPKEIPPITAPVPSPVPAPAPMPQEFEPQKQPGLPPGMPSFPMSPKGAPGATPQAIIALLAGFGIIILVVALAFYIYYCLCLFLIARKLNVPGAWVAWIPVINIYWPFVGAAGKSAAWILILISPIIAGIAAAFIPTVGLILYAVTALLSFIVTIYLWICITENLGKNKWLGLLILVPVVNIIFIGFLAFSRATEIRSDTVVLDAPTEDQEQG